MSIHVFQNAQQENMKKILHSLLFSIKIKNVIHAMQLVEHAKKEMMKMIVPHVVKEDSSMKINVLLNAQKDNMEIH